MAPDAPFENRLLRARARGEVSADAAFETLYREYAGKCEHDRHHIAQLKKRLATWRES